MDRFLPYAIVYGPFCLTRDQFMKEHLDLTKELNITKESAGRVIRCLNISLKSSCNVVARSIIEMVIHGEYTRICDNVEFIMNRFRRESNYSVSK